jgi:hypothetical protein
MLDYYGEGVGFIYELDTLYMVANSVTLSVVYPVTRERIKIGNVCRRWILILFISECSICGLFVLF